MITLSGEEKSWTVKRISSDPLWKDSIPDLEIKNVKDNVVFLTRKVFISMNFSIVYHKQELRGLLLQRNHK